MTATPDDTQWFQWVFTAAGVFLTGAMGWTHKQIGQVKKDAEVQVNQLRVQTLSEVQTLRTELNSRHDMAVAIQERQHADNRAALNAITAIIQANSAEASVERRRFADSMERLHERLGGMADRDEIRAMIADKRARS